MRRRCEEAFDDDFADIDAARLADEAAGWPPHVATAIKDLVRSATQKGLCHQSSRKRLALADALATLTSLQGGGGGNSSQGEIGGSGSGAPEGSPSSCGGTAAASAAVAATAASYVPTPLSMQVCEASKDRCLIH